MPTKKFEGTSINSLIEKVRREVGSDAKIIRAQKVRRGGLFGFFARELFELTVEVPSGLSSVNRSSSAESTTQRSNSKTQLKNAARKRNLGSGGNAPRKMASRAKPNSISTNAKRLRQGNVPHTASPGIGAPGKGAPGRQNGMDSLIRQRYFSPSDSDNPDVSAQHEPDDFTLPDSDDLLSEPLVATPSAPGPSTPFAGTPLSNNPVQDSAPETYQTSMNVQDTPVLSESDYLAMRYWAYFLVPRSDDERGLETGPSDEQVTDRDLDSQVDVSATVESADINPMQASAKATNKAKSYKGSGEHKVDLSYLMPVRTPGTSSTALERVSPPFPLFDSDELSMLSTEEFGIFGEAPALPTEIVQLLNRARIAGEIGWSSAEPDQIGISQDSSPEKLNSKEWEEIIFAWKHQSMVARASQKSTLLAEVFQAAPFFPTGLSRIGFPAALLADADIPKIAKLLVEDPSEIDNPKFALELFISGLRELPNAPAIPSGIGQILIVAGEISHARKLAASLAQDQGVDPNEVVVAAPQQDAADIPAWMLIPTKDVAEKRRPRWNDKDKVTIIAMDASLSDMRRQWAKEIIEALSPDMVCGIVESTHKPEDVASWAIDIGRVDCLAIRGRGATMTPASVLACGIPIALIDGEKATDEVWSSIISERLAIC